MMNLRTQIEKGLATGIITYDGDTVKFDRYAIGGIVANTTEELIDAIENCCYRADFGGMEYIKTIQ